MVLATGARPQPPYWATGRRGWWTSVTSSRAAPPAGRVVVVDELGFHQATSVAELLADRGCEVEVITPGWSSGRISASRSTWRPGTCGRMPRHQPAHRPGGDGRGATARAGGLAGTSRLHHPTGAPCSGGATGWCARRQARGRALARAAGAPFEVHRVGDCVAPRRAHAAVIEGERAGWRCDHSQPTACVLAVIVVRDGQLPPARRETIAEAGGAALIAGSGTGKAADGLDRPAGCGWSRCRGRPGRAGRHAGAGARGRAWSCCRRRPTGAISRRGWPCSGPAAAGRRRPVRARRVEVPARRPLSGARRGGRARRGHPAAGPARYARARRSRRR